MLVGFFLSPFILHRLGNVAYGVWVLAVSMVGYLGLLELGMGNSVLRFVSKGHAQQDHQASSDALSAALWVRLQISALVFLLSIALAAVFPLMFSVPTELASEGRKAILIIGLTASLSLSLGVVGGVLGALNRYDLQNYAGLVQTAVRVLGVYVVLRSGHGIVAIAVCELIAATVGNIIMLLMARRLYPELRIRLRKPNRETLGKVWTYSSYSFLINVAIQLVNQTDNMVVGAFVSTYAVTFYAIANSLCRYANQVVASMGNTFIPAASTYEASGDTANLLRLYKNGTRATLAVSLPMMITLIVRGPSFIGLWMGPQYAQSSGVVLIILGTALLFGFANRTAGSIAVGIEKHKTVAWFAIGEGIVNLILSVVLAKQFGLYGVAIGTLVPSLVVHLFFWPTYIAKLVRIDRRDVVWRIWGPMVLAVVPFAIVSYVVDRTFPARNLAVFFGQVLATLPVFLLTIALFFRTFVRKQIVPKLQAAVAAFS